MKLEISSVYFSAEWKTRKRKEEKDHGNVFKFSKNFHLLILILKCFNLGFETRLQIVFIAWIWL